MCDQPIEALTHKRELQRMDFVVEFFCPFSSSRSAESTPNQLVPEHIESRIRLTGPSADL